MTRAPTSLQPGYFDALYARHSDPWRFAESAYERGKYAATLAALSRPRYARALEVGCSIGVLTQSLARRCDALLAVDAAAAALNAARQLCADQPQVQFGLMQVPRDWPQDAGFELILLSEVVYYLDLVDVGRLAARVAGSVAAGADILLVHWTGETNYPLSGDAAAEAFIAAAGFALIIRQQRTDNYRLDLLRAG